MNNREGVVVRRCGAVALVLVAGGLLAGGALLGWGSYRERQVRALEAEIVDRYKDHGPLTESLPGVTLGVARAVRSISRRAKVDPSAAAVLNHLKAGAVLDAAAASRAALLPTTTGAGANGVREQVEAHFAVGTITALSEPARARESFARAAALDPTNRESQFWHGWLELLAGNQNGAERAYSLVVDNPTGSTAPRGAEADLPDGIAFWSRIGLGDIGADRRRNEQAIEQFGRARALAQRLVSGGPSSIAFQRMWGIASDRLGGALIAAGRLEEAQGPVRDGLAVATRLAEMPPANKGRLRELALAHSRVGDLLVGMGKTEDALGIIAAGIAIARRVVEGDKIEPVWRRDLAVALVKAGDAERDLGRLDDALRSYEQAHDVIVQAAASVPAMRSWQEDVSVSNERIGDAHLMRGNAGAALSSYQAKLNVARELATASPDDERRRRDLALAHQKIASAQQALGETDNALKSLGEAKELLGRFASGRELAQVNAQVGEILKARGLTDAALAAFKQAEAALAQLLAREPGRVDLQREVAAARDRIGDLSMQLGKLEEAMAALQASLAARESLAKRDPGSGRAAREVAVTLGKIGDVLVYQQKPVEALPKFRAQLEMSKLLADAEPDNAIRRHDVAIGWERIGRASFMVGDQTAAKDGFERALVIYDDLLRTDGDNAHFLSGVTIPLVSLGSLDAERRQALYGRAYRILRSLADAGRLEPRRLGLLNDLERNLGGR